MTDIPVWIPPVIILVVELTAILSLYRGQHQNQKAHVQSRFAELEIIAMGVQYSDWPIEVLLNRIATVKSDLADTTQIPSLLESILEKGVVK